MAKPHYKINKLSDEATLAAVSVGDLTKSNDITFEVVNGIEISNSAALVKGCDKLLKKFGTMIKV